MQLTPYHLYFSEQAQLETRVVTFSEDEGGIKAGTYFFQELFCAEFGCNCRRALITVHDADHQLMANISYGWADLNFYAKWMGSRQGIEHIPGINLYEMQPQGENCLRFVALFKEMITSDPAYEKRIRRHYQQMKELNQSPVAVKAVEKVGRNEPCLCGSGKKAKKCCL